MIGSCKVKETNVIEKGFSEGENIYFPILTVRVKYRKETVFTLA